MKVAVLGCNGFLGKLITKWLDDDGYKVIPVSRQTINLNEFNSVKQWLTNSRIDCIVNCVTSGGKLTVKDSIYKDVQDNLNLFLNFYNNSNLFGKFINIGSGAEFDMSKDVTLAKEESIFSARPESSYGFSKNIIARMTAEKNNFYTLRLFGCFDSSESDFRFLKRCSTMQSIDLENKEFDFISAKDFYQVLKHYLNNDEPIKDINCVYNIKFDLASILDKFISYHNLKLKINVKSNGLNYTGNGDKLALLDLKLDGLDLGLKQYK